MIFALAPAVILTGYYPSTSTASFMLSDHSRSPLQTSFESYDKTVTLSNGLTRKYIISTKKKLSLSWTDLPSSASGTVDNGAGAYELQKFYENNYNNTITVTTYTDQGSGTPQYSGLVMSASYPVLTTKPTTTGISWTAFIDSFSCDVNKRYYGGGTAITGKYDLWNVNLTLGEA